MMKAPFFKIMILWLINKGRVHGYEIMNQLQGDSLDGNKLKSANPSKIYPILHDLEKNGLIEGTWEYHGKRKLKYYEITVEGINTLSRIKNVYKNHRSKLLEEFMRDMFFKEDE
jgi:DNA-binding PadR family transcriptional regulator